MYCAVSWKLMCVYKTTAQKICDIKTRIVGFTWVSAHMLLGI